MAKTIKKVTLSSFIGRISDLNKNSDHTFFFRGQSDEEYSALPSIFRAISHENPAEKYVKHEKELFHNMIMQCPDEFLNCASTFDHLVKMQHYGLPTRLLDITSNPLVALYFACCSKAGKGEGAKTGKVSIYKIPNSKIKVYNSDTISLVSNLAKASCQFNIKTPKDRTAYLHTIKAEKPFFEDLINEDDLCTVWCVKPKLDNKRIIKQSGAFLIFGMGVNKTDSASIPDEFKFDPIEIRALDKKQIIKELESVSISEASLFPEIDKVARYLMAIQQKDTS